jgi:hypothetical protein
MIKLIRLEWNKIKYSYLLFLLVSVVYSIFITLSKEHGYAYYYNIEIWQESNQILSLTFALFAVIPTCWMMYYERKNNYLAYTITRVSRKRYLTVKWLITSILGSLIIFLVSFLGLLISLYIIKDVVPISTTNHVMETNFAGYYFVNKPLVYGILLSFWRAVLGFLASTLGFILSLYIKNIFIILTGPFVSIFLIDFILAIINIPQYGATYSFDPCGLDSNAISICSILIGSFWLIILSLLCIMYFSKIKRERIYEL